MSKKPIILLAALFVSSTILSLGLALARRPAAVPLISTITPNMTLQAAIDQRINQRVSNNPRFLSRAMCLSLDTSAIEALKRPAPDGSMLFSESTRIDQDTLYAQTLTRRCARATSVWARTMAHIDLASKAMDGAIGGVIQWIGSLNSFVFWVSLIAFYFCVGYACSPTRFWADEEHQRMMGKFHETLTGRPRKGAKS